MNTYEANEANLSKLRTNKKKTREKWLWMYDKSYYVYFVDLFVSYGSWYFKQLNEAEVSDWLKNTNTTGTWVFRIIFL